MSSTIVQELFNGGIVTKRHPTMLDVGELQQADDCVYRSFDPSIYRAPGKSEFRANAITGSPAAVKGLVYLPFDLTSDLVVAHVGATLYQAPLTAIPGSTDFLSIAGTGTMSNVGDEIMNVVPFGNQHYILVSHSSPRRLAYITPSAADVATSTIAGDGITVTTATTKGFKNAVAGQYVSGTGIPANTRILSKTSDTVIVLNTASTPGLITISLLSTPFIQGLLAGLQPTSLPLTAAVTSGSWSTTSELGAGKYWFIYTEMLIPGAIDSPDTGFIESGMTLISTSWAFATIATPAAEAILITRPSIVNSSTNGFNDATHWQVYMSDKQTTGATIPPPLSTFKRVGGPVAITLTTTLLTDVNITQGGNNPTTNAAITGVTQFTLPAGGRVPYDGAYATTPLSNSSVVGNSYGTFGFVSSGAVNGGTLSGSETIRGIRVTLFGANITGSVTIKTPSKVGSEKTYMISPFINPQPGNSPGIYNMGGETDTWGETWTAADFTNGASFTLEIRGRAITDKGGAIDGISVLIFYTGTSINRNGRSFRSVTYRDQIGTTVTDTVNLPPPVATTGDVFDGSLVLNDEANPGAIVYSLPGVGDSFTTSYKLKFNTAAKDIVTNIKNIGQVLVVGLRDGIQRVNYLPTELDTDFHQGLAHESLATDHGIAGPHAATLFDFQDGGSVLAYVSLKGLRLTNGITTRFLNLDLDWANTVDVTKLGTCILRNYSSENWLILYYCPAGASHSQNTRALIFPYSPDKIKDGGYLPAVGPIKVSARSAVDVKLNGSSYVLTGHNTLGKVYVEDQGFTLPSTYTVANTAGTETAVTISPLIKTRRMYPSGISRQSREQRFYVMCEPYGATTTFTADTTIDSTSLANASSTVGLSKGQILTGTGLQPDTIITLISGSTITISKAAKATGTTISIGSSTGTLGLTVRGQDIGEAPNSLETLYQSTQTGGLIVYHADNLKEALEFELHKVRLPDLTQVQLDVGMRLHHWAYLSTDMGMESHRA